PVLHKIRVQFAYLLRQKPLKFDASIWPSQYGQDAADPFSETQNAVMARARRWHSVPQVNNHPNRCARSMGGRETHWIHPRIIFGKRADGLSPKPNNLAGQTRPQGFTPFQCVRIMGDRVD